MKDFFGDVEIVKQSIMAIKEASSQMADIDQAVILDIYYFISFLHFVLAIL